METEMKQNEAHVSLLIYNFDGELDEITKLLGITPSEVNNETQRPGMAKRWQLNSKLEPEEDPESHLKSLLERLSQSKEAIKAISVRSQCQINVAYYMYDANPQVYLNNAILRQLADLKVDLYFDMYNMTT